MNKNMKKESIPSFRQINHDSSTPRKFINVQRLKFSTPILSYFIAEARTPILEYTHVPTSAVLMARQCKRSDRYRERLDIQFPIMPILNWFFLTHWPSVLSWCGRICAT
ncbi:hypothetical protein AVEN_171194-1 [Araneus ventricosus]|uniref:Uncharacterized protein n=1 Tax=Araneus ventricosus TaxID=182803 RepID=A0A4Y2JEB0_ARAVE|nr:hypothetical protein AVEN_171194-1 [Araneus ventricosus]